MSVRLSGMARQNIGQAELYEIGARALALRCDVGVTWSSRHRWLASAKSPTYRTERVSRRSVYDALEAALDRFEEHERDRYTPEELWQIYSQSEAS